MDDIEQKGSGNNYTWKNLTSGKLLTIALILGEYRETNPLAKDCYNSILNFFYKIDKNWYDYIRNNVEEKTIDG